MAAALAAPCGSPQAYVHHVLDLHEHRWQVTSPPASPEYIVIDTLHGTGNVKMIRAILPNNENLPNIIVHIR